MSVKLDQLIIRPLLTQFQNAHPEGQIWENRQYSPKDKQGVPYPAIFEGISKAPFRPDLVLAVNNKQRHIIIEILEDSHRQQHLFYHPQNEVVRLMAIARAHMKAKNSLPAILLINIPRCNPEKGLEQRLEVISHVVHMMNVNADELVMGPSPQQGTYFPLIYVDVPDQFIHDFSEFKPAIDYGKIFPVHTRWMNIWCEPAFIQNPVFQGGQWSSGSNNGRITKHASLIQYRTNAYARSEAQRSRVCKSNEQRGGGLIPCLEPGCTAQLGNPKMPPSRLVGSVCQHLLKVHQIRTDRESIRAIYGLQPAYSRSTKQE